MRGMRTDLMRALIAIVIGLMPGPAVAQTKPGGGSPPPPPLTSVTHDATLSGSGTATSPLGVVPPAVPCRFPRGSYVLHAVVMAQNLSSSLSQLPSPRH